MYHHVASFGTYDLEARSRSVSQGTLHTYLRHYPGWEEKIPGLATIRQRLPVDMQDLIKDIAYVNEKTSKMLLQKFDRITVTKTIRQILDELESRLLQYLRDICAGHMGQPSIDTNGKSQLHIPLTPKQTLVIGVSSNQKLINGRPIRQLITAYIRRR
uniref:Transposase n=1 Tax=Panagrellus redivivus TaxID=6233 RepID=A0A7E4V8M7_PANRE